jgi:hypothetical protein
MWGYGVEGPGVNQTVKTEQGQNRTQLEAKQVHRLPRKQFSENMLVCPPCGPSPSGRGTSEYGGHNLGSQPTIGLLKSLREELRIICRPLGE